MSLYDYANGDPINLYDPDGRVAIGFVKGLVMGAWSQPSNPAQAVGAVFGQLTSYFIPVVGQAAIVRDSTYSAYSAYNRIADIQQNGWSAGNAFGLGMDALGALPVLGTATKVAGTATKAGSTFLRAEQSISGFGSAGIIRASEMGSIRVLPSSPLGSTAKTTGQLALPAPSFVPNAGGTIRSFIQETDQIYYRVSSGSTSGSFITAVPPRSSAWAREALALPEQNTASYIQEVLVPAGTRLQRSRALPAFGRRGGAEQFEILKLKPGEYQPVLFGDNVPFY